MPKLLILLTLTPEINNQYRDRLKAKFPQLQADVVDHHTKVGPYIAGVDILLTFAPRLTDDVLRAATSLKWVQALGTGVDNLIDAPSLRRDVIVTNVHGIHGPPVSEAAIASMLAMARDVPAAVRAQDARQWLRWPAKLLHGKTVGIFGVGAIAAELAPKCKSFGMRVVGISSTPRDVPGFDKMFARGDLAAAVRELDFLVLLTPLTPETRGIVDAKVLASMKPTSFIVNLARGGVVVEPELVQALQQGRIAGAALDVFDQEPLPTDHPFWSLHNVIITTHQGGFSDVYIDHALPTVETNMRHFLAGDLKSMVNVVPH